jgi:hypothetical protein
MSCLSAGYAIIATLLIAGTGQAQSPIGTELQLPHLQKQNGHYALMVDGKPYLALGAQINNSSSWASTLPDVWPALEAMHVNTVEASVYWEQMEAHERTFDSQMLIFSSMALGNIICISSYFGWHLEKRADALCAGVDQNESR